MSRRAHDPRQEAAAEFRGLLGSGGPLTTPSQRASLPRSKPAPKANAPSPQAMLDANLDPALLVDDEGRIISVNEPARRFFGIEPETTETTIEALFVEDMREVFKKHREAPRNGGRGGLRLSAKRRDGSTTPVEVSLGLSTSEDRAPLVFAVVQLLSAGPPSGSSPESPPSERERSSDADAEAAREFEAFQARADEVVADAERHAEQTRAEADELRRRTEEQVADQAREVLTKAENDAAERAAAILEEVEAQVEAAREQAAALVAEAEEQARSIVAEVEGSRRERHALEQEAAERLRENEREAEAVRRQAEEDAAVRLEEAEAVRRQAEEDAAVRLEEAEAQARELLEEAEREVVESGKRAERVLTDAEQQAEAIVSKASAEDSRRKRKSVDSEARKLLEAAERDADEVRRRADEESAAQVRDAEVRARDLIDEAEARSAAARGHAEEVVRNAEARAREIEAAAFEAPSRSTDVDADADTPTAHVDDLVRGLLASLARSLRDPVLSLAGLVDTMSRNHARMDASDRDELTHRMLDQADKLRADVERIVELAKLSSGGHQIQRETVEMKTILDRGVEIASPSTGEHRVMVSVMDPAPVAVDPVACDRVLQNLLANSARFSPRGGVIRVNARVDGDMAVISVSDDGEGVPDVDQGRIFEPFQRGSGAGTRGDAAGLGLALARSYVELMGGRIWVESRPGVGSTFFFSLPLAEFETPTESSDSIRGARPERVS